MKTHVHTSRENWISGGMWVKKADCALGREKNDSFVRSHLRKTPKMPAKTTSSRFEESSPTPTPIRTVYGWYVCNQSRQTTGISKREGRGGDGRGEAPSFSTEICQNRRACGCGYGCRPGWVWVWVWVGHKNALIRNTAPMFHCETYSERSLPFSLLSVVSLPISL